MTNPEIKPSARPLSDGEWQALAPLVLEYRERLRSLREAESRLGHMMAVLGISDTTLDADRLILRPKEAPDADE